MQELLAQRLPHYQSCAQIEIDTEGKSPQDVTEAILAELHRHGGVPLENA